MLLLESFPVTSALNEFSISMPETLWVTTLLRTTMVSD